MKYAFLLFVAFFLARIAFAQENTLARGVRLEKFGNKVDTVLFKQLPELQQKKAWWYYKKWQRQQTRSIILLASSGALFIAGEVLVKKDAYELSDGTITPAYIIGLSCFFTAGIQTLVGIPMLIASRSSKRKFTVAITPQAPVSLAPHVVLPNTGGAQLKLTIPL